MKDLGELKFFLGIEFVMSRHGILMCQRKYALELISESGLSGAKPAGTHLELNQKLTTTEFDKCFNTKNTNSDEVLKNPGTYQRLVGRLLYLTMTRPDIAFVVQVVSQCMHSPKVSHMEAALRVVTYLKQAPGLGLLMPEESSSKLTAYCDSDWGACIQTMRSVTGYLVKFGNALISWKSKKQSTVSRSLAEVEFRSMASCAAEVIWLTGLFNELGVKIELPTTLICNSKAAIQIADNPIFHERIKHIDIDCHFVREKISVGLLRTEHVNTEDQLADLLTKGLGKAQHEYLLGKFGLKNLFESSA
ncbi:PREDICTED: uncharacterized protein LOC109232535 [Nicotiana attenuata]|uniref:uncharacterized protein LOC109222652 n=1 Tax=Nicotiana attenuata TaxID=49451 RepID=UPI000905D37C|nr:PREDICTED: uncharacterized protein LOC109222652 [Nicotiana attenuata]XP_019253846.1 PREDICTED: uncharacterized protein LOC109232535 [Nicotiana attenuata]